ncbi:hypothetical protein ACUSIJ_17150 [Pseudochelatococcus sp. B33]
MSQTDIGDSRVRTSQWADTGMPGNTQPAPDIPTGTAEHLFGETKLVQVLKAATKEEAVRPSVRDRWPKCFGGKSKDDLGKKAEHAAKLFESIRYHRGYKGETTAYNALTLLANILRSAKPEALAVIDANVDDGGSSRTFSLTISGERFQYSIPDPGGNATERGYLDRLQNLVQAHRETKNDRDYASGKDASQLASARMGRYTAFHDKKQRASLKNITLSVLHSYAPTRDVSLAQTKLAEVDHKLKTLVPWLNGLSPDKRASELRDLLTALDHSGGPTTTFATEAGNCFVRHGLLPPTYRGPGSRDKEGNEIPPPPPESHSAGQSKAVAKRNHTATPLEAFGLDTIAEETDDDLDDAGRSNSFSATATTLPLSDSDGFSSSAFETDSDTDDVPPPPPLDLPAMIGFISKGDDPHRYTAAVLAEIGSLQSEYDTALDEALGKARQEAATRDGALSTEEEDNVRNAVNSRFEDGFEELFKLVSNSRVKLPADVIKRLNALWAPVAPPLPPAVHAEK